MTNFSEYLSILETPEVTIHHLSQYFDKKQMDYDAYGNIFIGEFNGRPILVAHLDNVLKRNTRIPCFDITQTKLFGKEDGIGFDDKAGIIAIIELLKRGLEFDIIFTSDEEIGGVGASKIDPKKYQKANFILELDRRSHNDIIQQSGNVRLCDDEFAKFFEDLGFEKNTGTFTDLNVFKKHAKEVNMANLSIGYFNAHSDDEYLDIDAFENVIESVNTFLVNVKDKRIHRDLTKDEPKSNSCSYGKYNYPFYNNDYEICDYCGRDISPYTRPIKDKNGLVFCCEKCQKEYEDLFAK